MHITGPEFHTNPPSTTQSRMRLKGKHQIRRRYHKNQWKSPLSIYQSRQTLNELNFVHHCYKKEAERCSIRSQFTSSCSRNKYTANSNTDSFKASCSHTWAGMKSILGAEVQTSRPHPSLPKVLAHVSAGPRCRIRKNWGQRDLYSKARGVGPIKF